MGRYQDASVIIILGIILGFTIGMNYDLLKSSVIEDILPGPSAQQLIDSNQPDSYILNSCKGLSLKQTAFCLKNELTPLINYTVRNEHQYTGSQGSFQDVLKNGGDCYDYNGFYARWARVLGFRATQTSLSTTNKTSHVYTTIYSSNEYCILDQGAVPQCYKLIAQPS